MTLRNSFRIAIRRPIAWGVALLCTFALSGCFYPFVQVSETDPQMQQALPDTVLFDFGKITFNERFSAPYFDRIAAILREQPSKLVKIEGHTDNIGDASVNQIMSELRAEAIRQELLIRGIPAERMRTEGHAFSRPIVPNDTEEGRKINRRVEITVLNENMSNAGQTSNSNSFSKAFSELKDAVDDGAFKPKRGAE